MCCPIIEYLSVMYLKRRGTKIFWYNLQYFPNIFLEVLNKTTNYLSNRISPCYDPERAWIKFQQYGIWYI